MRQDKRARFGPTPGESRDPGLRAVGEDVTLVLATAAMKLHERDGMVGQGRTR